jgi:putative CocE/NonD family hydrolase
MPIALPPAETHDISFERELQIPLSDGVVLLADRCFPKRLGRRPTLLVRSPYPERKYSSGAELLAERGFNVLIVSSRGSFSSGGRLNPFRQEGADGADVIKWLKTQDWFNNELVAFGASYGGYTSWSAAASAGPMLKAMALLLIESNARNFIFPNDVFALELFVFWSQLIATQDQPFFTSALANIWRRRRREALCRHLPLGEIDRLISGATMPFWQEWLEHEGPHDPWWAPGDHSASVSGVSAPVHLFGGWHDFAISGMLRDYQGLRRARQRPYLTVGPWTHFDLAGIREGMRQAIIWLRSHALGDRAGLREKPVRIFMQGENAWRELEEWPPPNVRPQRLYLHGAGNLGQQSPKASPPGTYRYDPNDPTPSVGTSRRARGKGRAIVDNSSYEARPDVLTYTSSTLQSAIDIMGSVSVDLFVKSTLENTDFFARICDVTSAGRSLNVCDALIRLFAGRGPESDADGLRRVALELSPTAYRFQAIYHEPRYPSSILLPIVDES